MLVKNFTQIIFIALMPVFMAFAADDTILVTADRIKSTLDKSPSDIKVFELAEIEKSPGIIDLLSSESDVRLAQSGPAGSNVSLFLRGTDSSHTLVIIDGVIMNDPGNPNRQFDLGRLSLNNVERIEILKGSQGLLYGSNAIGGVILITSKKAQEAASGSASFDYGTFETFNGAINYQKKFKSTSISIGADHFKTRGFSAANIDDNPGADDDGEKRSTISTGVNQEIGSNDELVFNYRYVNDEADLDKGGGPGNDDVDDSQFTEQQFMKALYNHQWSTAETNLAYAKAIHHRTLRTSNNVTTKGEMDTVSINHTQYSNEYLTQNLNLDFLHEEDQLKNYNENLSMFLYNRLEFGTNIVNFGARLDHNKFFGEHLTYKASLMHFFSAFTLKMNYSTGFRAPGLNQLYDPVYGNKDLNPEESQTADLGFEIPITEKINFLTSFFYTELSERLSYNPVTFVNQNRGRAKIIGTENNFYYNVSREFRANFSATWLSARDMTARQKLARRPSLNSKLGLNYELEKHTLNLEGDFTGKRPDVDNLGNPVSMSSFLIFNIHYAFSIDKNFSTYLKIRNLLDKNYEEVFGYGTGGRAASLGIKYLF